MKWFFYTNHARLHGLSYGNLRLLRSMLMTEAKQIHKYRCHFIWAFSLGCFFPCCCFKCLILSLANCIHLWPISATKGGQTYWLASSYSALSMLDENGPCTVVGRNGHKHKTRDRTACTNPSTHLKFNISHIINLTWNATQRAIFRKLTVPR